MLLKVGWYEIDIFHSCLKMIVMMKAVIWIVCDMELIDGITTWRQALFHSTVRCMALIT